MNSSEKALRAVRAQVQFELAQVTEQVAHATKLTHFAQRQVDWSAGRCESVANELRASLQRKQIVPAQLTAMHRLYRIEQSALHAFKSQLNAAREREEQVRAQLAQVRNRERSLERALQAEQRKELHRRQSLELLQADDLWLQHSYRN